MLILIVYKLKNRTKINSAISSYLSSAFSILLPLFLGGRLGSLCTTVPKSFFYYPLLGISIFSLTTYKSSIMHRKQRSSKRQLSITYSSVDIYRELCSFQICSSVVIARGKYWTPSSLSSCISKILNIQGICIKLSLCQ